MLSLGAALPSAADNEALLPFALDQRRQGSCVGHAVSEALWGALNRAAFEIGQPAVDSPSPFWCYYVGRVLDGSANQDVGTSPYSALHGVMQLGFVPNSQLPYSDAVLKPEKVRIPELERLAFDQKVVDGLARITSTGTYRVNAVKQALAAGYIVVFGTEVDDAFENLGPSDVWPGCTGYQLGGHCMVFTGYRTVNGRTQFHVRNSWGPDWCDRGSCWFEEAALAGCEDLWIVSAVPAYSGTEDA
jgi:hypothetical protein